MNFSKLKKNHTVKVPQHITTLYCDKKNLLTFIGPFQKKSIKVKVQVFFLPSTNSLVITDFPIDKVSNIELRNSKAIQGTTIAKIKQMLIEINYTLYHKLEFVGVGYRAFSIDNLENQLYFKLGYSHLIYFKINQPLQTFCSKHTKLFIFGNCSYETLTQTAALIQDCKRPEPYKGKGILHYGQQITLKKGKKI
jgi:large subunit ribosomal protein L6